MTTDPKPDALLRVLPPCLAWHPDGEVRVVGRRIGLFQILRDAEEGHAPERIADWYDLPTPTIAEVLRLADDHPEEVGAYRAEYQAELDRRRAETEPSPAELRLRRKLASRDDASPIARDA